METSCPWVICSPLAISSALLNQLLRESEFKIKPKKISQNTFSPISLYLLISFQSFCCRVAMRFQVVSILHPFQIERSCITIDASNSKVVCFYLFTNCDDSRQKPEFFEMQKRKKNCI